MQDQWPDPGKPVHRTPRLRVLVQVMLAGGAAGIVAFGGLAADAGPKKLLKPARRGTAAYSADQSADQRGTAPGTILLDTIILTGSNGQTEGTGSYTAGESRSSTAGLPLSLRDTPQSVTVVSQQRIKDQQAASTRDVLDYSTGVSSYAAETDRDTTYARGFSIGNYVIDGQNLPAYEGWYSGASMESSAAIYDRVEVLHGAAGLLTGTGEPGASVSMQRKRATSSIPRGSVELRYGSWNHLGGTLDVQGPLTADGRVRARFIADLAREDSYLDRYHVNRQAYYGTVEADLTDNTRLILGLEHRNHDPHGSMWGEPPIVFSDGAPTHLGRQFSTAPDWAYWSSAQTSASARVEHDFGNGWAAKGSLGLTFREHAAEILQIAGFPNPLTGRGLQAYPFKSEEHNRLLSIDVSAGGPVQLAERSHTINLGLHADRDWKRNSWPGYKGEAPDPGSIFDYHGGYSRPDFNDIDMPRYAVNRTKYSLYGSGQFNFSDRTKLVLGARYTDWKQNSEPVHLHFHDLTPYAGIVFDLDKSWSAYASYTEIFNPQDARTRTGAYLDPIIGKSREIGAKAELLDGRLNVAIALFDTLQDNVATRDGDHMVPGTDRHAYIGTKGVNARGVDLELSGEVQPDCNMFLGINAQRVHEGNGKKYLPWLPTQTIKLFTACKLAGNLDRWTVGGGMRWQNATSDVLTDDSGKAYPVRQSSYTVIDLMARYDLDERWSAQLNINNLFDKTYHPFASSGLYGAPRNATLALTSRF